MGVSFKREDTMRFFQELAFLLLPLLVAGQAERDGGFMDTSEKWECYVFGQCEEYSVNFEKIDNAEACHKFCGKNDDCKWWTWEPSLTLCSLFANCTDPKHSTGHPDAGPCSDCISGQQACPGRECHSPDKCQGHAPLGKNIAPTDTMERRRQSQRQSLRLLQRWSQCQSQCRSRTTVGYVTYPGARLTIPLVGEIFSTILTTTWGKSGVPSGLALARTVTHVAQHGNYARMTWMTMGILSLRYASRHTSGTFLVNRT